jgi:ABC-type uncharacterized transport system involved in gliding motility auxiliary subunit
MSAARGAAALDAAASLAALLGLLALGVAAAARHPVRIDLTRAARFTPSEETVRVLAALPGDVVATAFYKDDDDARLAMEDLLVEYAAIGRRFRYRFIDPDRSPGLAREMGVRAYGTTIVASDGRRAALFVPREAQLTEAVVRVTRPTARRAAFLTGHGERGLRDGARAGFSAAAGALAAAGIDAREAFLLRASADDRVLDPAETDALVVAGPSKDLLPEERAAIERFLDEGGALLALVDPGPCPELGAILEREGILLGDDIVVDRQSKLFGADILVPVVSRYPQTEITRAFEAPTFFPIARSVALAREAPAGSERAVLVETGEGSWGERDTAFLLAERKAAFDSARDRRGPVPLAALAERPVGTRRARVVVFGDADFADNAHFALSGNGDLFQNALAWTMGDEEPMSIRARDLPGEPVVLSSRQGALLFWGPVVAVPGFALALGTLLLLRRR